jgi:predicted transcriptional regulator
VKNSVNGWGLISKWLGIRQKRQKYLAEILGVSNSAVSQYKKGNFLLNGEQMKIVTDTLNFSQSDIDEFYAEVSNARFAHGRIRSQVNYEKSSSKDAAGSKSSEIREEPGEYYTVPKKSASACQGRPYGFVKQKSLVKFEPLLETLDIYAKSISKRKIFLPVSIKGCVALKLDDDALTPGLLPGSVFLLDCHNQPDPGEIAAYQLYTGEIGVLHYQLKDDEFNLISDVDGKVIYLWSKAEAVKAVKWLYPVRAIFSDLHKAK